MTCEEFRDRIFTEEAVLERHAATCAECREFLGMQGLLDAELRRAYRPPAMPAHLKARVRAAARHQERQARMASFGEWAPLAVGLLLTLVCLVLVPTERPVVVICGIALTAVAYLWEAVWALSGQDR
jgi:hypothetical protein